MKHLLSVLALAAFVMAASPVHADEAPGNKLTIVLAGDSTVTDAAGWGRGFAGRLREGAACVNLAQGGRSSKSYRAEGWWDKCLAAKPDVVLIQFGHNDQPGKGPERETDPKTTFPENLARYVREAKAAGARPVLVTSMERRRFDAGGRIEPSLNDFAAATRRVDAEERVPLIDLQRLSIELYEKLGPAGCDALSPRKDGAVDTTHLNEEGGRTVGKIVAEELARRVPELAAHLDVPPGASSSSRPTSSRAAAAKVKIALAGDSTVTDKAGWGVGFAALLGDEVELINLARGGRSSRTFREEGLWAKCLDTRADYVLIQFGHNDEPGTERSTDRETEFPANIRRYVTEARDAGMKPVLVTPLVRRQFKPTGRIESSLARHAEIVKQIATEMGVPVIHLHARSLAVCDALGEGACVALLSTVKPDGRFDGTHLTPAGSMLFGAVVADELKTAVPDLAPHLLAVPRQSPEVRS